MTSITEITAHIAALESRRAELLAGLADARALRATYARRRLLGDAGDEAVNRHRTALARETEALALMSDAEELGKQLQAERAAAKASEATAARAAAESAFNIRLATVVAERGLETARIDRAGVKDAYVWLFGKRRTETVNRDMRIDAWVNRMVAEGARNAYDFGLIVAAYMHGDVLVEAPGSAWAGFLGITDGAGREPQSLPLTGDPTPPRPVQDKPEAGQVQHITLRRDYDRG